MLRDRYSTGYDSSITAHFRTSTEGGRETLLTDWNNDTATMLDDRILRQGRPLSSASSTSYLSRFQILSIQSEKSGSFMLFIVRGRGTSTLTMLLINPGRELITAIRSQSITASSMLWVTRITVFLSRSQMRKSSSRMTTRVCASRLANGSSISTTSGSL